MKENRKNKHMMKSTNNSNNSKKRNQSGGHSGQYDREADNRANEREDRMQIYGTVEDALPGTWFKIITESNVHILATLSGKLRQNNIRILPGDYVIVEVSPYDMTRGRITWRK